MVANGKHRKTRIFRLVDGDQTIIGDEALKAHITHYYKGLFGRSEENNISLVESRTEDIPQVSVAENEMLTDTFTEKEVKQAIFQMEQNKAPGPDSFPAEFY